MGKLRRPPYDKLWKELLDATMLNGGETDWFKGSASYWIRVFVTAHVILCRILPSRNKPATEAALARLDGIAGSDSYSAWNDAGSDHQRYLPRCFRDLYRTLEKNHAGELEALFDGMHGILRDAAGLAAKHPEGPASKGKMQKLQDRIDAIAHAARTGRDRRRYAKRPRREDRYLLTFLELDADYHSNPGGRAPRAFAC